MSPRGHLEATPKSYMHVRSLLVLARLRGTGNRAAAVSTFRADNGTLRTRPARATQPPS